MHSTNGSIEPMVIDRSALTGHTYEVRFRIADAGPDSGSIVYDVVDLNTSEVKASGFTNQSDALGPDDYPVVDGVLVKVNGAPVGFKNFLMVANGAGPIDPRVAGGRLAQPYGENDMSICHRERVSHDDAVSVA